MGVEPAQLDQLSSKSSVPCGRVCRWQSTFIMSPWSMPAVPLWGTRDSMTHAAAGFKAQKSLAILQAQRRGTCISVTLKCNAVSGAARYIHVSGLPVEI